jgi:aminoglycoside phosphotransferase (APT) family kinase protein
LAGAAVTALSETTYSRPGLGGVPFVVQIVLEQRLGTQVANWTSRSGGYTAALASRLELTDGGRVFVKGIPVGHPLEREYAAEAAAAGVLPEDAPVPLLLGTVDDEWLLLVFEDIEGDEPDLSPGSDQAAAAVQSITELHRMLTPAPLPGLPSAQQVFGRMFTGWSKLAARPPYDLDDWAWHNLDKLVAMESAWLPWSDGDTMLHSDLRPDNLIYRPSDGRVYVVDWANPVRGAGWLDLAGFVPFLVRAGHSPRDAEAIALDGPETAHEMAGVPAWAVTGFAVALAGYWSAASRQPEPIGALGLREFQAEAAAAALAWVAHRTRWT